MAKTKHPDVFSADDYRCFAMLGVLLIQGINDESRETLRQMFEQAANTHERVVLALDHHRRAADHFVRSQVADEMAAMLRRRG